MYLILLKYIFCPQKSRFKVQKSLFSSYTRVSHAYFTYLWSKNYNFYIYLYIQVGQRKLNFASRKIHFFQKIPKMVSRRDYNHIQHLI